MDAKGCGGWGVFIVPNHFVAVGQGCWRRAHRTFWCATGHPLFIVWCSTTSANRSGSKLVDRWRLCLLAAPDSPVPSNFAALTLLRTIHRGRRFCRRPLALDSRCSTGSPDSPVNYSRARPGIPESGWFGVVRPGAPDCPVPQFSAHSSSLLQLNCAP